MSIFISGSVAYDTILSFNGVFADHLLEGSLEKINLTFQTPVMSKNFGGCAANERGVRDRQCARIPVQPRA